MARRALAGLREDTRCQPHRHTSAQMRTGPRSSCSPAAWRWSPAARAGSERPSAAGWQRVERRSRRATDRTALKMTDEQWYSVVAVNLSGAFFMSRAALEHMLDRGTGRIVNISSIIGQTGNIGQTNYAASKSGLFGLTRSMAREAAFALQKAGKLEGNEIGITVNAVAPGFIETEMLETVPE